MKRIHIRFARCIVASVTTLACVGLFPLTAAHADVAASAAQSGAPTAPAATSASSEDTPTATPTPTTTPASSELPSPNPDPSTTPTQPEPPTPATSKWVHHPQGWRYESSDGTWLAAGVFEVNGVRYVFNTDGFVPVGWYRAPDGTWYASTENGVHTGWYQDGSWYLLTDSGAMVTGWQVSGGAWYYLNPDAGGAMATGWTKIDGTWYYLRSSGAMAEATWIYTGAWYYLTGSGAMTTGWFISDGSWYYADSSGAMTTGWLRQDSSWYYLSASGAMVTGWLQRGASWYYLDPNAGGAMATAWTMVSGSWNYFDRWDGFWVSGRSGFEADWNYAKTLYSPTNYLVVVDTNAPHCMTFYWADSSWQPLTDMPCSVGKPSTPTIKGTFTIKNRGSSFGHGYTAYWWTQFHGDYLFHSVLYYEGTMTVKDGTLGGHVSHGCVRLRYEDAKWLHDTIPSGTYVTIY